MGLELLKKGIWTLLFRVLGAFLAFVIVIFFARILGAEKFGLYSLALTIVTVLSVFVRVGVDNVVIKQVSAHFPDMPSVSNGYVSGSIALVAMVGILAFCLLWSWSTPISIYVFSKPPLSEVLKTFALLIIPLSLVFIMSEVMKAMGRPAYSAFMQVVLTSAITLTIVAILWLLDATTLERMILAVVMGYLVVSVLYFIKLSRFVFAKDKEVIRYKSLIRQGWPMLLVSSGGLIMAWSDVIVLGIFSSPEEVGVYSVAARIVMVTSLVLIAVNSVVAPRFARFYKENKVDKIALLAQGSSVILMITVLIPTIIFLSYPDSIMGLFGSDFVIGATVLTILAIGQFVNVSCGSVVYLLTMSGREVALRNIMLISAVINVVLSIVFVNLYGMMGVALATAFSLSLWNIWAMYEVKKHLGFWTLGFISVFKLIQSSRRGGA